MCGIWGYMSVEKNKHLDLTIALQNIMHRGPDSNGYFQKDGVGLVHARLAIQDLSDRANQPMYSFDGRYIIVFNGEIYNHIEIRQEYLSEFTFISNSDTETILYAYMRYKENILTKLNGIFSFAIYDTNNDEFFIARDHFGVKPLYYSLSSSLFCFSSELKSILPYSDANLVIDQEGIVDYLSFLWATGDKTPVKNIRKLLPGHYAVIRRNEKISYSFKKYYSSSLNGTYFKKSEIELVDELDSHLQAAVRRQLLSDVPVGFFLSGGLDSTLLVAIARKLYPETKIKCYSIDVVEWNSHEEGFTNDIHFAKNAAAYLNVDLSIISANPELFKKFDQLIWSLEEPQADLAPLHILSIAELAKNDGIKVLIGGTAGDDIFSGYRRHQLLKYHAILSFFPKSVYRFVKHLISHIQGNKPLNHRLLKVLDVYSHSYPINLYQSFVWTKTSQVLRFFKDNTLVANYNIFSYFEDSLSEIPAEKNRLNQMLHLEMKTFLVDHNLNYTDKMGMATGVEIRVPYLDLDLVRFAEKIPPRLKMKGMETKYLLKKVAERYLPKEIIYRSKTGFGAPVRKWITNELGNKVDEMLNELHPLFDKKEITKFVEEVRNNKIDGAYTLLSLLSIHSWFKQFMPK